MCRRLCSFVVIAVIGLCTSVYLSLCVCFFSDVSPLPASTVPAPADHCFLIETLPSSASPTETAASATRKQRVRRSLSQVAETASASMMQQQQGSACCVAGSGTAVSQNSSFDAAMITRQSRARNKRSVNVSRQSDETSSGAVSSSTSNAGASERNVSDSSVNSSGLLRLRKSSTSKTAVVKNAGSVPVVVRSTNAAAAAAAATAACDVVILVSSSATGQRATRSKTLVDDRSEKVVVSTRRKRRRPQSADCDVEPDEQTSTDSSALCEYC